MSMDNLEELNSHELMAKEKFKPKVSPTGDILEIKEKEKWRGRWTISTQRAVTRGTKTCRQESNRSNWRTQSAEDQT